MKSKIIKILKIVIPVLLGFYIAWYFWSSFDEDKRTKFFDVFSQANYFYVFLAIVIGFISHWSRARRWKYALKPMGYKPSTFNAYNAIMIGYIANIVVPRMGEASRAGVLKATDDVPFDNGFGSIVAERVIDVICLGIVSGLALLINIDKLDDFLKIAEVINDNKEEVETSATPWGTIFFYIILLAGLISLAVLWVKKPNFQEKVKGFFKGLWQGIVAIFKMKDRWQYLGFTALIWICYVGMFWIVFYALPFTAELPISAVMAAFVAGTIGFILVQGGIGLYPIMVGSIITFYRNPDLLFNADYGGPAGEDVGFGMLVWASQTALIVVLGLISLALVQKGKKKKASV